MNRRAFIAGFTSTAVWPIDVKAADTALPVIGFISPGETNSDVDLEAFRHGLNEAGFIEGRNVILNVQPLTGNARALATDFVTRQVALIVSTTPGALAAKSATSTIPILFATGGDPVELGLVPSLSRPGGNVTGVMFLGGLIESKRVGLLHEMLPQAAALAVLFDPNGPTPERQSKEIEEAAHSLGIRVHFQNLDTARDFDDAFAKIAQAQPDALLVAGPLFFKERDRIVAQAARYNLPAMYGRREFVEIGGLTSYGTTLVDSFRQVGVYAGQILKGAKPAELPVLQTAKFEFLVNLKTAKSLGLAVPPTLLARADEVIE